MHLVEGIAKIMSWLQGKKSFFVFFFGADNVSRFEALQLNCCVKVH